MKTAFVTGASRGIGRAIALELARLGYQTALAATHLEKLKAVAQEIKALSPHASPLLFALDVTQEKQVKHAIHAVYEATGTIDVLVNSAGILVPGTSKLDVVNLQKMFDVNVLGAFHCIQAIAPHMKEKRSGYIFNIASLAGKIGRAANGGYSTTKFALVGLNESLCYELSGFGIKTTAICPGWVDTDMATAHASLLKEERLLVSDIAQAVRFLLQLSPNCCIKEVVLESRYTLK